MRDEPRHPTQRRPRLPSLALALAAPFAVGACVPVQRMCVLEADCGAAASCLAGRCVARGFVPAIETSRRRLFTPVDVAYLHRGGDTLTEGIATLGSVRDEGAVALLRFSIPLPPDAVVLEAFLVLERATAVDADPTSVSLHPARIAEPWDAQSVSWAGQPRIEEMGAPVTVVTPSGGALVRLDVRDIVRRWRRRRDDEYGIAVVASSASRTGIAFALTPVPGVRRDLLARLGAQPTRGDPGPEMQAVFGPRLELYVK